MMKKIEIENYSDGKDRDGKLFWWKRSRKNKIVLEITYRDSSQTFDVIYNSNLEKLRW